MERPLIYLSDRLWARDQIAPKSKARHAAWFAVTSLHVLLCCGIVATEYGRELLREPWSELWRS